MFRASIFVQSCFEQLCFEQYVSSNYVSKNQDLSNYVSNNLGSKNQLSSNHVLNNHILENRISNNHVSKVQVFALIFEQPCFTSLFRAIISAKTCIRNPKCFALCFVTRSSRKVRIKLFRSIYKRLSFITWNKIKI